MAPKTDLLDLRDDGTIQIRFDDTDITLRRPKTGELKATLLELDAIRKDALARIEEMREQKPDDDADPAEIKAFEDDTRAKSVDGVDFLAPWVQSVIDTLATNGQRLPEDPNDWPVWLTNGDNSARFIQHWRSVPLGPGKK